MGELGLLKLLRQNNSMETYCRKLMALPFLPHEQIPASFYELKRLATSKPTLVEFCEYVERQWIVNDFYNPARWSVYMQDIRTNNDLEGWHRRLNNHARRGQIQFYLLVELLHREARFVNIQTRLVSEGKLKRHQRKKYKVLQSKVKKVWNKYNRGDLTVSQLLTSCSHI